jgi:hypothetical protein
MVIHIYIYTHIFTYIYIIMYIYAICLGSKYTSLYLTVIQQRYGINGFLDCEPSLSLSLPCLRRCLAQLFDTAFFVATWRTSPLSN